MVRRFLISNLHWRNFNYIIYGFSDLKLVFRVWIELYKIVSDRISILSYLFLSCTIQIMLVSLWRMKIINWFLRSPKCSLLWFHILFSKKLLVFDCWFSRTLQISRSWHLTGIKLTCFIRFQISNASWLLMANIAVDVDQFGWLTSQIHIELAASVRFGNLPLFLDRVRKLLFDASKSFVLLFLFH